LGLVFGHAVNSLVDGCTLAMVIRLSAMDRPKRYTTSSMVGCRFRGRDSASFAFSELQQALARTLKNVNYSVDGYVEKNFIVSNGLITTRQLAPL
jgi:hypothetical protein